jgi:hypothetical protein
MMLVLGLIGTVLTDGVPCQRFRTVDGREVWISGLPEAHEPGDKLSLDGQWRFLRSCQANVFVVADVEALTASPKGD